MATQITSQAAASDLGRRRTFGGRLAAHRRLWSVAIVGALALALVTSLALGRALRSDQAGATAGSDAPAGNIVHAVPPRVPAEACVYAGPTGIPGEGCAPAVVAPAAPTQGEGCVYASLTGSPGEGCSSANPATVGAMHGTTATGDGGVAGAPVEYLPGETTAGTRSTAGSRVGVGPVEYLPGETGRTTWDQEALPPVGPQP